MLLWPSYEEEPLLTLWSLCAIFWNCMILCSVSWLATSRAPDQRVWLPFRSRSGVQFGLWSTACRCLSQLFSLWISICGLICLSDPPKIFPCLRYPACHRRNFSRYQIPQNSSTLFLRESQLYFPSYLVTSSSPSPHSRRVIHNPSWRKM